LDEFEERTDYFFQPQMRKRNVINESTNTKDVGCKREGKCCHEIGTGLRNERV